MRIRIKLPLYSSLILLVSIGIISFVVLSEQYRTAQNKMDNLREREIQQSNEALRASVETVHKMLIQSYESSKAERIKQDYGLDIGDQDFMNVRMLSMNIMNITMENIRLIGQKGGNLITINEMDPPYPFVLHPTQQALEGTHKVEYVGKDSRIHLYEKLAKLANEQSEGELIYDHYQTGEQISNKMMVYVKLFDPLSWMLIAQKDISYIEEKYNIEKKDLKEHLIKNISLIGIATLILLFINALIIGNISFRISNSIKKNIRYLKDLSKGKNISVSTIRKGEKELRQLNTMLKEISERLGKMRSLIALIGTKEFNDHIDIADHSNEMVDTINKINQKFEHIRLENERQLFESKKRNWATEGLAKFSDILRHRTENLEELAHEIVMELTRYIDANQGALFLYNDTDPEDIFLEAIATFAYAHKRFYQKRVELGEGLAGQCALEKETIYITNIPDDYINITSGLGTANPKSILIVPMKVEANIFGILEIASFNTMEKYQIEFVEKLSESIASTLYSVRISQRTSELLEMSKQQAQEHAEQEEKMRANLLELEMLREKIENRN